MISKGESVLPNQTVDPTHEIRIKLYRIARRLRRVNEWRKHIKQSSLWQN